MSRSYRGIILAAVGWLTLCAADHPNPKTEAEQTQAQQSIASSLSNISTAYREQAERAQSPDKQAEPCKPGDDRRYSDLCAQWKAADAAADSAWWAWASGIVGFGSLFGVFVALGLALHSNWIARDTARRQLRSYVSIRTIHVLNIEVGKMPSVVVELTNQGQTPAYDVRVKAGVGYRIDGIQDDINIPDDIYGMGKRHLGPGESTFATVTISNNPLLVKEHIDNFELGVYSVRAIGVCEYRDCFATHRSTFWRAYSRWNGTTFEMVAATEGNEAT